MSEYKSFFYAELLLNWLFPFLFLMWNRVNSNFTAMIFAAVLLALGQWVELYMSIMPNTTDSHSITYIEVGTFVGFSALFIYVFVWSLKRMAMIPKNHPYLIESMEHH